MIASRLTTVNASGGTSRPSLDDAQVWRSTLQYLPHREWARTSPQPKLYDRVIDHGENNRNGGGRLAQRRHNRRAVSEEHVGCQLYQLCCIDPARFKSPAAKR